MANSSPMGAWIPAWRRPVRFRPWVGAMLLCPGVMVATAWGALALYYAFSQSTELLRALISGGFATFGLLALIGVAVPRWRGVCAGVFAAGFALLLVWWSTVEPSNDRDWKTEAAVAPYAEVNSDGVRFHNIRNFDYSTENDFTPAYYDKVFDLAQLQGVDLIASYWMGPHIAHIFLSFDFGPNDHLAISIERRDERGEKYSTLRGMFRQFELFYVVADERDVIRLRTNFRRNPPEDVYLYRLQGSAQTARRLFLEYVQKINDLRDHPQFYNTLMTNCTTSIWVHAHVDPRHLPFSWKIVASGHVPEYLYERGVLDRSVPFDELTQRSHINTRAMAADKAPDFSRRIRGQAGS